MSEPDWHRFHLPAPEELRTPDGAAIGLVRLLFAQGPTEAEAAWGETAVQNQMRAEAGGIPTWFEVAGPDEAPRYIFIGDGVGQYRAAPPSAAELAGATLIKLPPTQPAPLTACLEAVLARLPEDNAIRRNAPRLLATLAACRSYSALAPIAAFRDAWCGTAAAAPPSAMMAGLEGMIPPPAATRAGIASAWLQLALDAYVAFRLPGPIAVRLMLLTAVLERAAQPSQQLLDAMAGAAPDGILGAALAAIFDSAGGPAITIAVADDLAARATQQVEQAQAAGATDQGAFMGRLFASLLLFQAAFMGCKFLAGHPGLDAAQAKLARSRTNGYDEDTVLSLNAVVVDAGNALDGRFVLAHRARIAKARAEQGDAAAEALWIDYTDRQRFYPLLWKPFLMGSSDSLRYHAAEG